MLMSIISLKLGSMLAKDMVNSEIAKRALTYAGKSFIQLTSNISESIRNQQQNTYARLDESDDETKQKNNNAPQSTEYLVYNWLEASFAWFQMVVLWHDPVVSIFSISGLFASFLLLTYFAPRFYATIMIGIFLYNLTKVWFKHVWPEIRVPPANINEEEAEKSDVGRWTYLHPQIMTLNEFKTFIRNLIKLSEYYIKGNLLELRREKPTSFCILICSTLSCTAYIGNCIDGSKLIFSMVIALSTLPGIYLYLLPESLKANLQDFSSTFQNLLRHYDKQQRQHLQLDLEKDSSAQDQREEKEKVVETLSLFDHLKRNSFLTQLASLSSSYALTGTPSSSSSLSQTIDTVNLQSNAMDGTVPIRNEKIKEEERKDVDESFSHNKNSSSSSSVGSSAIRRRLSDDLSSNDESTSLIDLDDDQQDGFVML